MSQVKKVVLAYSGGLDTSIILKWLQDEYACEVVTFTADIGQGEEVEAARAKAEACGAVSIHIEDLTETFVRAGSTSSPCPISAVKVTTSQLYSSCSHLRMTEVSRPPE